MHKPRQLDSSILLSQSISNQQAINLFLKTFGGKTTFKDKAGEAIILNQTMFYKHGDTANDSKFLKDDKRKSQLAIIAQTIKRPDEIWVSLEKNRNTNLKNPYRVVRHYVANWTIKQQEQNFYSIFEVSSDGLFFAKSGYQLVDKSLESVRVGIRLYKRGE